MKPFSPMLMVVAMLTGCSKTVQVQPYIPEPTTPIYGSARSSRIHGTTICGPNSIKGKQSNAHQNANHSKHSESDDFPLADAIPGWTDANNTTNNMKRENAYRVHLEELSRNRRIAQEKRKAENAISNDPAHSPSSRFETHQKGMIRRTGPAGSNPSQLKPVDSNSIHTQFYIPTPPPNKK